jgi:Rad3-related DNA helicase
MEYCRPQPKIWDIVVVNHTLLAIDLLLGAAPGFLIGEYPIVVIDEAHKAPEMFRSAVTESVTLWGTGHLLKAFERDDQLHAELTYYGKITEKGARQGFMAVRDLFAKMHAKIFHGAKKTDTIRVRSLTPFKDPIEALQGEVGILQKKISDTAKALYVDIENHTTSTPREQAMAILGRIEKLVRRLQMLHDILGSLVDEIAIEEAREKMDAEPKQGNWIIIADDKGLHRKPVRIGDVCGKALANLITHRVLVSATLTIGGDFRFIRDEFGIDAAVIKLGHGEAEHTVEAIYKSPFDLHSQALLYTPATLPTPAHPGTENRNAWITSIAEEIEKLALASQGDAFVLFSAKADLKEVLETINEQNLLVHGIKILPQIDGIDAQRLTEEYLSTPSSMLFGLKSFWEGIDVPGDKLRLVVVPKLPFPNPKDPVIEALSDVAKANGDNPFMTVSVPQMLFDLKQAVGRLIRTKEDKGIVALLDTRVWSGTSNQLKHTRTLADIRKMRTYLRENPDQRNRFKGEGSYRGYGKKAVAATGFTNRTPSFTKAETFVKKS